jgi:hypothetical protein
MAEALHALEKLADAVDALATGSGRVRDRLFEASTYLTRVRPEDIPDEDLRPHLHRRDGRRSELRAATRRRGAHTRHAENHQRRGGALCRPSHP